MFAASPLLLAAVLLPGRTQGDTATSSQADETAAAAMAELAEALGNPEHTKQWKLIQSYNPPAGRQLAGLFSLFERFVRLLSGVEDTSEWLR